MSKVDFESLQYKIERARHDYTQIQERSQKLLDLIVDQVTKELGAPAGTITISKKPDEHEIPSSATIPERMTAYVVEMKVGDAKISTTIKAKRNVNYVDFDGVTWRASLHEVGMGSGTSTSNAVNDLSAKTIQLLDNSADKYRPE